MPLAAHWKPLLGEWCSDWQIAPEGSNETIDQLTHFWLVVFAAVNEINSLGLPGSIAAAVPSDALHSLPSLEIGSDASPWPVAPS